MATTITQVMTIHSNRRNVLSDDAGGSISCTRCTAGLLMTDIFGIGSGATRCNEYQSGKTVCDLWLSAQERLKVESQSTAPKAFVKQGCHAKACEPLFARTPRTVSDY